MLTLVHKTVRTVFSVVPTVLNKVEGATHHSMVLTALREEEITVYQIGPTMQDRKRTAYPVSKEEEWTAYQPAPAISNKEGRTAH